MWNVTKILENDYGCEERGTDEPLKVLVCLQDENGNEKQLLIEDAWLIQNEIEEGTTWPENIKV